MAEDHKANLQKENILSRIAIAENKLQNYTSHTAANTKERLIFVKTQIESGAHNIPRLGELLEEVEIEINSIQDAEISGYDLGWLDEHEDVERAHFTSFVKDYPTLKKELQQDFASDRKLRETIMKRLEKYGEQPELLDPHLTEMVALIMEPVLKALKEGYTTEDLEDSSHPINASFHLFHKLTCIRGHKTIVRIMPHEVHDLEPALMLLQKCSRTGNENWVTEYGVFLWLSIIILIPFDLDTVDSESNVKGGIVKRILEECRSMVDTNKRSVSAAKFLLAKLFSRPDVQKEHLSEFFDWANQVLESHRVKDGEAKNFYHRGAKRIPYKWNHSTQLVNVLQYLCAIYKHAPRELLQELTPKIDDIVEEIAEENFSMVGHATCKLLQRIALIYLKPVVAKWRYKKSRVTILSKDVKAKDDKKEAEEDDYESDFEVPDKIEDILATLLDNLSASDSKVRWSSAKGIGRITMRVPLDFADEIVHNVAELMGPNETDFAWQGACLALGELARRGLLLPERLKMIVPLLNKAMNFDRFVGNYSKGSAVRDASCYVAWAFARAYEPDVMKPFVPDIARGLLSMAVFDREGHCRRAAAAAFQENVGRQRNFPHGIDIVTTADYFTVGVRKRAYLEISKFIAQFDEYQQFMINHLIHHKLHYWDKAIRELSAGALYNMTELNPKYMLEVTIPILIPKCQAAVATERHGSLIGIARILLRIAELEVPLSPFLQKKIRNIVPKLERDALYRGKGGVYVRQGALLLIEAFAKNRIECSEEAIWRHMKTIVEGLRYPQEDIQDFAVPAFRAFCEAYLPEPTPRLSKMLAQWCEEITTEQPIAPCRGYGRALGALPVPVLLNDFKLIIDALIKRSRQAFEREKLDYISRYKCCDALAEIVEKLEVKDYDYTWDPIEDKPPQPEEDDDEDEEMPEELRQFLIETGQLKANKKVKEPEPFLFHCNRDEPGSSLLYDRIFSCFISRFIDYETDRRGDVGSFVRQFVLRAMITLIRKLRNAGTKEDGSPWLRPIFVQRYVSELIRQSLGPLSRLRLECCGLFTSLHEIQGEGLYPHQDKVIINLKRVGNLDMDRVFRDEVLIFEKFRFCWRTDDYRKYVLDGFLKTVKRIEHNKKNALLGLFDAVVGQVEQEEGPKGKVQFLETLCKSVYSALTQRRINQRKAHWVESISTLGMLMSRGVFADLATEDEEGISIVWQNLYDNLRKGASNNIKVDILTNEVILQMIRFPNVRQEALELALMRLVSRYPRVRSITGENLYTNFLTWGDSFLSEEINEQVQAQLLMVDWGEEIDETAIAAQHEIVELLKLPESTKYAEESEV